MLSCACSLVNAPADIKPGGTAGAAGSGGMSGAGGTMSSGGSGGAPCAVASDCPVPPACMIVECKDGVCKQDQAPNNTPCDDGRFCTESDFCALGQCTGGPLKQCPASGECTAAACDEDVKGCVETPKRDGALCDDKNACTPSSTCMGGVCTGGNQCMDDDCNTSMCDPQVGCVTKPKDAMTPCGISFCSVGQCDGQGKCAIMAQNVGLACDDGQFCTANDVCTTFGLCQGSGTPCQNPAPCVKATCDEEADQCKLTPIAEGEACEDGDACTGGETCNVSAQCTGGQPAFVAFFESFANLNLLGWELGPEWEIGMAKPSVGGDVCCDPAVDHDGDGMVAGVVLGGNEAVPALPASPVHPFYYLTSPAVDTSLVPGPLYLTYYRWLTSDYPPFMHNNVEVSSDGGASWFVVWSYDLSIPINDMAWTFQSHDISAYKSQTTRFRFGFDIGQTGVYSVGSWNVDHIKLQNSPCGQ